MINDYLDALNYVWYNYYTEELSQDEVEQIEKHLNIVQDSLKRLEAIDNANPSEALKYVNGKIADLEDDLQHYTMVEKDKCKEFFIREDLKQFTTIKPALQKSQEQEKVLEIIFEKGLSLAERDIIKQSENYKQYQIKISWWNYKPFAIPKSKEDFELLKRYLGNE